jgi:hypothetical protein
MERREGKKREQNTKREEKEKKEEREDDDEKRRREMGSCSGYSVKTRGKYSIWIVWTRG